MNEKCAALRANRHVALELGLQKKSPTVSQSLAHHPAIGTQPPGGSNYRTVPKRLAEDSGFTRDLVGAIVALPLQTAVITTPVHVHHTLQLTTFF